MFDFLLERLTLFSKGFYFLFPDNIVGTLYFSGKWFDGWIITNLTTIFRVSLKIASKGTKIDDRKRRYSGRKQSTTNNKSDKGTLGSTFINHLNVENLTGTNKNSAANSSVNENPTAYDNLFDSKSIANTQKPYSDIKKSKNLQNSTPASSLVDETKKRIKKTAREHMIFKLPNMNDKHAEREPTVRYSSQSETLESNSGKSNENELDFDTSYTQTESQMHLNSELLNLVRFYTP